MFWNVLAFFCMKVGVVLFVGPVLHERLGRLGSSSGAGHRKRSRQDNNGKYRDAHGHLPRCANMDRG
jgi:hypothetical protein